MILVLFVTFSLCSPLSPDPFHLALGGWKKLWHRGSSWNMHFSSFFSLGGTTLLGCGKRNTGLEFGSYWLSCLRELMQWAAYPTVNTVMLEVSLQLELFFHPLEASVVRWFQNIPQMVTDSSEWTLVLTLEQDLQATCRPWHYPLISVLWELGDALGSC